MRFTESLLRTLISIEGRLSTLASSIPEYSFSGDWVSHAASIWSEQLSEFKGRECVRLLEIGSHEGRSARWFLDNILTHRTSSIMCVDTFPHKVLESRFDHNIRNTGCSSKVIKIKGDSKEVLKLLRRDSCDIVYIDGSHRAIDVHTDARLSWELLKTGGVIIFDDYAWQPEPLPPEELPAPGIDRFLEEARSDIELLHKGYQVIIKRTN
jgi:predicted O-methyltransferase YrrM